jgi:hypothetical protein
LESGQIPKSGLASKVSAPYSGSMNLKRYEGNQRDVPGSLNGQSERSLMPSADSTAAPGFDLGSVRQIPSNPIYVFVIYVVHMFYTEAAHPSAGSVSTSGAPTSSAPCPPTGASATSRS